MSYELSAIWIESDSAGRSVWSESRQFAFESNIDKRYLTCEDFLPQFRDKWCPKGILGKFVDLTQEELLTIFSSPRVEVAFRGRRFSFVSCVSHDGTFVLRRL